jgi:hypothetical protein
MQPSQSAQNPIELLGSLPDNATLYRICSFDRLADLFLSRRLTLVSPARWVDPLEKFLLEGAQSINRRYAKTEMSVFAQCWSLKARSDALWTIYSPNRDGIRIGTTVGTLRRVLTNSTAKEKHQLFLGEVSYLPQSTNLPSTGKKSRDRFEPSALLAFKRFQSTLESREVAKLLLLKRLPFEHENEVRLISVGQATTGDLLHLNADPFSLVQTLQFDPRMPTATKGALKQYLKSSEIGFKGSFVESTLYSVPSGLQKYLDKVVKPKSDRAI